MKKITVVGSFVMDLIGLVDTFPKEGETVIGKTMKTLHGGKGANQAVSAARLGGDVQMIGKLGKDGYGQSFRDLFADENIDISGVLSSDTEPTALGLIQIDKNGENKIVVIPGANFDFKLEELEKNRDVLKASSLVVTQLELKHEVTFRLIDICYDLNVPLILNPAPGVEIPKKYLEKITYLTPNETELEILSGIKVIDIESAKGAINKLLDIGVENVIATLGSKGALIGNKEGFKHIKGYSVQVVDTIGAGDSFNGALAYCIVNGTSLEEAVKYANAVGALTVTGNGAIPSLPRKEVVDKFIKDNPLI